MHHSGISCRENAKPWRQSNRGPSFETRAKARSSQDEVKRAARRQTLMVRSRESSVSNHEARTGCLIFEHGG